MNLKITGIHMEVTPALRDYLTSKMERVIRRTDNVIDIVVTLSVDKLVQKAEANVHLSGKDIRVAVEKHDMYAAIDFLIDKLERQVVKHKEKVADHRVPMPEVEE